MKQLELKRAFVTEAETLAFDAVIFGLKSGFGAAAHNIGGTTVITMSSEEYTMLLLKYPEVRNIFNILEVPA